MHWKNYNNIANILINIISKSLIFPEESNHKRDLPFFLDNF